MNLFSKVALEPLFIVDEQEGEQKVAARRLFNHVGWSHIDVRQEKELLKIIDENKVILLKTEKLAIKNRLI